MMMVFVMLMRLQDVKMQQHVIITRTQQMMMVLVFLLMVFVRLVGETDGTGTIVGNDADDDGVCDADEIAGCQMQQPW